MYPSKDDPYFGSFIRNIKEGLELSGAKVDILAIEGQGKSKIDKMKKYINFYYSILKVNSKDYDYVHLSYPSHTFLPLLLKPSMLNKLIVRLHGLEIVSEADNDTLLPLRRFVTKIACKFSKVVVVPSDYFKNELLKLVTPEKIYKYPSGGIDTSKFYIANEYEKRIQSDVVKIGYVGRIDLQKGVDILLKSLVDIDFKYELTIIGKGPLLNDMKVLASDLNINANFVGPIDNEKLISYYNNFDVFVFPTERKGASFGNVAIEAMACGVPLIGSRFAGLTEYLVDDENGYFFEVSNHLSLNEKLKLFARQSKNKKIELSKNAENTALKYEKYLMSNGFYNYIKGINK